MFTCISHNLLKKTRLKYRISHTIIGISHNLFKKTRLKYRISHTIIGISHTIANVILIIQSSTLNKL